MRVKKRKTCKPSTKSFLMPLWQVSFHFLDAQPTSIFRTTPWLDTYNIISVLLVRLKIHAWMLKSIRLERIPVIACCLLGLTSPESDPTPKPTKSLCFCRLNFNRLVSLTPLLCGTENCWWFVLKCTHWLTTIIVQFIYTRRTIRHTNTFARVSVTFETLLAVTCVTANGIPANVFTARQFGWTFIHI